jgi:hypothetical protein
MRTEATNESAKIPRENSQIIQVAPTPYLLQQYAIDRLFLDTVARDPVLLHIFHFLRLDFFDDHFAVSVKCHCNNRRYKKSKNDNDERSSANTSCFLVPHKKTKAPGLRNIY